MKHATWLICVLCVLPVCTRADATAEALKELRALLKSGTAEQRAQAAGLLGEMGPAARPAVSDLVRALKDRDPRCHVAPQAAIALSLIQPPAKEVVPALTAALARDDWKIRLAVAKALRAFGPDAKESAGVLVTLLASANTTGRYVAWNAMEALSAMGSEATGPLADALQSPRADVRALAAAALARMGTKAKPALAALRHVLSDADPAVRVLAALAVRACGSSPQTANAKRVLDAGLVALQQRLRRPDAKVVHYIEAAGEAGPDAKALVPELIDLLKKDFSVRASAADALGRMGPAALPQIRKAIGSGDHKRARGGLDGRRSHEACSRGRAAGRDGAGGLEEDGVGVHERLQDTDCHGSGRQAGHPATARSPDVSRLDLPRRRGPGAGPHRAAGRRGRT